MIHRYWSGPPPSTEPWVGRVVAQFGDLHDWTDDTLPAGIPAWLDRHARQVRPRDRMRHRSNMVRWLLLAVYGGVWLDHDVIPTEPFPAPPWIAAHGTPCTCAIGLDRGDPLALDMLTRIASAPESQRPSMDVSGERAAVKLAGPRVRLVPLAFDAQGRRLPGTLVHLFNGG